MNTDIRKKNALTRREVLWVALGSLVFSLYFGFSIVTHLTHGGVSQWPLNDWDLNMEMLWVPFYSITHFHQFPLWDPYKCGGIPLLANPQSIFLTPFFVFHLLFGPAIGVHLEVIAHIAVAFAGGYFLARVLGLSMFAAIASGGAFAGSSWYYDHLAVGHVVMMPYTYIPWIIALFYLCAERRRLVPGLLAGFLMALVLMEGGVYALPQTALVLALLAAILTLQWRSANPLVALVVVGVSTAGFAAIKVLPSITFVGFQPRYVPPIETNGLSALLIELFSRNQDPAIVHRGQDWGFYEYGAYIGIFYGGLAVVGCVRRTAQALPWLIVSFVLLALAAGNFGPYSPWVLIHKVPLFVDLRLPTRGLIPFTLTVAVLAALGVDVMCAPRTGWVPTLAPLLVGLALIDSWLVSPSYLSYAVIGQEASLPSSKEFHQLSSPKYFGHMFMGAKANTGILSCYEVLGPRVSPRGYDQPGYRGEQYLLGSGTVTLARWTPNQLSYDVLAPRPTVLIVNQNYDEGWHLIRGKGEVFSRGGLIAVGLSAGRQHLEIVYRPRAFVIGLGITMLTFIVTLVVWRYERRLDGS
ncbi:MAG: hypothetical protein ABSD31_13130 [Candidatus Binataceae bacterium]|jgi:hypothetical protein